MKIFEENYKPIEITVKNIQGKEFLLTTQFQPSENTRNVELILSDDKAFNSDKIIKMMILLFGRDEKFFKQFSIELLSNIADYIREESKKKDKKIDG